jgi:hypothetical protein
MDATAATTGATTAATTSETTAATTAAATAAVPRTETLGRVLTTLCLLAAGAVLAEVAWMFRDPVLSALATAWRVAGELLGFLLWPYVVVVAVALWGLGRSARLQLRRRAAFRLTPRAAVQLALLLLPIMSFFGTVYGFTVDLYEHGRAHLALAMGTTAIAFGLLGLLHVLWFLVAPDRRDELAGRPVESEEGGEGARDG